MKYLPLIWAGLSRRRMRTVLTFLSIAVAFLLFGVLHGVSGGFDAVINAMSDTRVRVQNRVSFTRWMPLAMREQIERVAGVTAVVAYGYFGGYYQDPKNQLGAGALDMGPLFRIYPELELPQAERDAMLHTRTGALVGVELARKYGWKVGDRIAVGTPIWQQRDGSRNWAFDIVGIFRFSNDALPANELWINYDYFQEAGGMTGMASQYIVGIKDPASGARICREIDAMFRNSATPTLCQTEKEWLRSRLRNVGDVKFIVDAIIGAVLFTLLALTANTMMQSVRERIGEFAVLRTFGYSNAIIAGLVVLESLLLCLGAALCGLAIAAAVFPAIFHNFGAGAVPMPQAVIGAGLVIAILLALVSALPPLWRALRLDVAAALAAR